MERLQAYRYRLYTTEEQNGFFARVAGCCRWVYNQALFIREKAYQEEGKSLNYAALCRLLTAWRAEHPWLAEAPVHPLQQAIKNLCDGFSRFFQGQCARPRFKKKGRSRPSFRYPDPKQITFVQYNRKWGGLKLPKVGVVKLRLSRLFSGEIRSVTVYREGDGTWSVSILTRRVVADVQPASGAGLTLGLDLGIAQSITTSQGEILPIPQMSEGDERHRRRLARAFSRTTKGSKNREKARKRLSQFDLHCRRKRQDALHNTSSRLIAKNQGIALEDLDVRGMTRSTPGKGKAAKAALNRRILAQSWGEFRRQLSYKGSWCGVSVVGVPPAYTSQKCSRCGFTAPGNRSTRAAFRCLRCKHTENADINAAKNILAAGHVAAARRGDVRPALLVPLAPVEQAAPMKREPLAGKQLTLLLPPGIPCLKAGEDVNPCHTFIGQGRLSESSCTRFARLVST